MKRVLVCGGRDFGNPHIIGKTKEQITKEIKYIYDELDKIFSSIFLLDDICIISGCAPGVDTVALDYAIHRGDKFLKFPADWEKYGKAAGPIRNKQMLTEGKPDIVIAFQGGNGTRNMKSLTEQAGVELIVVPRLGKD